MALPDPEPGLVISYAYLWRWQEDRGASEAEKDRPAVVVLVSGDPPEILVVPITSRPVGPDRHAIEIPAKVAAHLGLDKSRISWTIVDEANMFHWPNDLRPVPNQPFGTFHYGFIPPRLFERIKSAVIGNWQAGKLVTVKRKS